MCKFGGHDICVISIGMDALEQYRFAVFLLLLLCFMGAETLWERKRRVLNRGRRWPWNLLLVVIDALALRLLFPIMAVGTALWATDRGIGLMNVFAIPAWLTVVLTVVLLDMAIYWQHRLFHRVPWLWRLHRVHHADPDIDVTTALRFHPIEIILSMLIKMALVIVLGAPALGVVLFEMILNGMAMFNHANMNLPLGFDRILRKLVVTPDMHRVHHSQIVKETDSNFGFNLAIWDRIFGSYIAQPEKGHDGVVIGLKEWPADKASSLWAMLKMPFVNR